MFVALSPTLRGRLHATDCAGTPAHLSDLASAFVPGQPLQCRVLQVQGRWPAPERCFQCRCCSCRCPQY